MVRNALTPIAALQNYYGPLCATYCLAQDSATGHDTCDSSGAKVCMNGYTGAACTAFCSPGYKCVGGVTTRCDGVTEYQDTSGAVTCKTVSADCAPGSYQALAPTSSSNRVCQPCTTGFQV